MVSCPGMRFDAGLLRTFSAHAIIFKTHILHLESGKFLNYFRWDHGGIGEVLNPPAAGTDQIEVITCIHIITIIHSFKLQLPDQLERFK